jgi:hypothetical protein
LNAKVQKVILPQIIKLINNILTDIYNWALFLIATNPHSDRNGFICSCINSCVKLYREKTGIFWLLFLPQDAI